MSKTSASFYLGLIPQLRSFASARLLDHYHDFTQFVSTKSQRRADAVSSEVVKDNIVPQQLQEHGSMLPSVIIRTQNKAHAGLAPQQLPLGVTSLTYRGLHSSKRSYYSGHDFLSNLKDQFSQEDRKATNVLIAANVATFLATSLSRPLFVRLVQYNAALMRGEWWRVLTASFVHGGIFHLLGNMLALHWTGPAVEQICGRDRFLLIYLTSVVTGGLAQYHWGPLAAVSMGSSGAIAGLFAAWITYKLRNRVHVGFGPNDMNWIGQIVVLNLIIAAMSSNVAHWAHLGGLLGGAASMYIIGPRYVWEGGYVVDRPIVPLPFKFWRS